MDPVLSDPYFAAADRILIHCGTTSVRRKVAALAAEIALLRAALEPFSDVAGEGSEDYPDDTPVVVTFGRTTHYALKLGDFRRASQGTEL